MSRTGDAGIITPALVLFAVLLAAGMTLTYLAEGGADTADNQDADRHPG
jgi:hypothetical protein